MLLLCNGEAGPAESSCSCCPGAPSLASDVPSHAPSPFALPHMNPLKIQLLVACAILCTTTRYSLQDLCVIFCCAKSVTYKVHASQDHGADLIWRAGAYTALCTVNLQEDSDVNGLCIARCTSICALEGRGAAQGQRSTQSRVSPDGHIRAYRDACGSFQGTGVVLYATELSLDAVPPALH